MSSNIRLNTSIGKHRQLLSNVRKREEQKNKFEITSYLFQATESLVSFSANNCVTRHQYELNSQGKCLRHNERIFISIHNVYAYIYIYILESSYYAYQHPLTIMCNSNILSYLHSIDYIEAIQNVKILTKCGFLIFDAYMNQKFELA